MRGKSLKQYMKEAYRKDPGLKERMARLDRWSQFYKLNPALCPHNGIVSQVSDTGEDLPGTCLTCGTENVITQGDIPDGEPFTIKTYSTAHTVTVHA